MTESNATTTPTDRATEFLRALFAPDDTEPTTTPTPTGIHVPSEGGNPTPPPDPDAEAREIVRSLFTD